MNKFENKSVILFDGICNLCNISVNYIIKHDKRTQFLFASLQSDAAKEILLHLQTNKINLDTVILIENQKIYSKSTAALKIIKKLDGPIKIAYIFMLTPLFIRDYIYSIIAKNRYKWFGKKKKCMLPNKAIRKRFL